MQIVIGASVVAVGVYAVKQMVGPFASKFYRRLYGIPDAEGLAASKAKQEDNRVAEIVASAIQSQVGKPWILHMFNAQYESRTNILM